MALIITLIVALLIEHIFWNASTWRQGDWFATYYRKVLSSKALARFTHQLSHPAWLLGPLVLLVAIGQFILLPGLGDLLTWLFGLGALLFSLGPRNLGRDLEDYLQAQTTGQSQQANRISRYFVTHHPHPTDTDRNVKQGLLTQANDSLVGPILGFILLGAIGAVVYRAIQYLTQMQSKQQPGSAFARSAQTLWYWVNWLPARITLLGYAIVGHFDAVVSTWQQQERSSRTTQDHTALLVAAGQAALAGNAATGRASLLAHSTLVKRTVLLWVIVVGIAFLGS